MLTARALVMEYKEHKFIRHKFIRHKFWIFFLRWPWTKQTTFYEHYSANARKTIQARKEDSQKFCSIWPLNTFKWVMNIHVIIFIHNFVTTIMYFPRSEILANIPLADFFSPVNRTLYVDYGKGNTPVGNASFTWVFERK